MAAAGTLRSKDGTTVGALGRYRPRHRHLNARPGRRQDASRIPVAEPVIVWLQEARVHSFGKHYVFPARRLVRERQGVARVNRYEHVGPDTLNVALKRLPSLEMCHFTVHDMRRTARPHLADLGVDRLFAERTLNHELRQVEGIYDRHDYFAQRAAALGAWATLLGKVEQSAANLGAARRQKTQRQRCCRLAQSSVLVWSRKADTCRPAAMPDAPCNQRPGQLALLRTSASFATSIKLRNSLILSPTSSGLLPSSNRNRWRRDRISSP